MRDLEGCAFSHCYPAGLQSGSFYFVKKKKIKKIKFKKVFHLEMVFQTNIRTCQAGIRSLCMHLENWTRTGAYYVRRDPQGYV